MRHGTDHMTKESREVGQATVVMVALLVVIMVLAGSLDILLTKLQPTTQTVTTTNTGTTSSTNTVSLATINDTRCSTPVQSAPGKWSLNVSSESPALICVSFYYYSQNSTLQLNTTSQLAIFGWPTNPTGTYSAFDATPNFTVDAQPESVTLGGPNNENEGVIVTYSIRAVPGTSGSFDLSTDTVLPSGLHCNGDFELIVGNGLPDFFRAGTCALVPTSPTTWSPYPPGYVFVWTIGITNSAG